MESLVGTRWQHKKRGSVYTVLHSGTMQAADKSIDDAEVLVYKGADGRVWVRSIREFLDGRFERIHP